MANNPRLLITVLIAVIVVMGGVLLYAFFIKPQFTGFTTQKQVEGYQFAIADIIRVVSQCQTFPIPIGEQTITLIALECLQQPQPQPTPDVAPPAESTEPVPTA